MKLTQKELNKILEDMRITIPTAVEKELLDQYGNYATDGEGYAFEYTEQDIYEQLRKKLRPYQSCITF